MAVAVWVYDPARGWQRDPPVLPDPPYWSANTREAQVGQMQDKGPDPAARGGFAAYSEWLRLTNPEPPRRD